MYNQLIITESILCKIFQAAENILITRGFYLCFYKFCLYLIIRLLQ